MKLARAISPIVAFWWLVATPAFVGEDQLVNGSGAHREVLTLTYQMNDEDRLLAIPIDGLAFAP